MAMMHKFPSYFSETHCSQLKAIGLGDSFAPNMVLLGSSADPNVVEKMVGESAKNNVQSLTGDKEDFPCVKGDNKGEEGVLKGEMDEFVSAQLEATAPRTMDKAMLRLNLKKPKVGGKTK